MSSSFVRSFFGFAFTLGIIGGIASPAQAEITEITAAAIVRRDGRKIDLGALAFKHYQQGIKAFKAGDIEPAIEAYNEAIRIYPAYARAYLERGNVYLKVDSADRALADYSKVIELKPEELLADAYLNRGLVYNKYLDKHFDAIKDFTEALRLKPQWKEAYYNRAVAYENVKRLPQAIQDYQTLLKNDPNYVDAYNNLGIIYLDQKKYADALKQFQKAVDINPQFALGYANIALTHVRTENYDQALKNYDKAIELNPKDPVSYHDRGFIYNDIRKDYTKALSDFTQAIALRPNYGNAYYNRALTYYNMNKYNEAIADFGEAIRINPKDADAYYFRGESHLSLNQYDAAIADFKSVAELIPDDAWSHYQLSALYALKKEFPLALKELKTAIQYNPEFKAKAKKEQLFVFIRNNAEFKKLVNE